MKKYFWLLGLTVAISGFLRSGRAADHLVTMTSGLTFAPDYLEIQAGDTVTWYNADDSDTHNASGTSGLWTTGEVSFEDSRTLPFNNPGTYPYRDSIYFNAGMTGTIVVKSNPVSGPILLVSPAVLPGGHFRFTITNLVAGKTNIIETSTNLPNWSPILTNVPTTDTLHFTNAAAASQRFFRSYQIP